MFTWTSDLELQPDAKRVMLATFKSIPIIFNTYIWEEWRLFRFFITEEVSAAGLEPVWPNGWVHVYEQRGSGFESSCSHLNFRFHACFEQGVPWHSGNYRVCIHSETRTWHDKNIQSVGGGIILKVMITFNIWISFRRFHWSKISRVRVVFHNFLQTNIVYGCVKICVVNFSANTLPIHDPSDSWILKSSSNWSNISILIL